MLNKVKHLFYAKHVEEDPSLALRMTIGSSLFPPKAKRGMASEAMPG